MLGATLPRLGETAEPWSEIVSFFESLASKVPEFAPLASFARLVAESPYVAAGLSGLTSMHDLIVGPSSRVLDNPHLVVGYRPSEHRFTLTYRDGSLRPWSRVASPERIFEVVERVLIQRVRWFRPGGLTRTKSGDLSEKPPVDLLSGRNVILAGLLPDRADAVREVDALTANVQRRGGTVIAAVMQRRGVSRASKAGGAAAAHAGRPLRQATYLGTGKARELQRACLRNNVHIVVFYNPLDQSHRQALRALTNTDVFDRFQLGLARDEEDG